MNSFKLKNSFGIFFILLFTCVTFSTLIAQDNNELPVYKDSSKPIDQRVKDLILRMTLEEKVDLVGGAGFKTKKNVRLGIPELLMADGPLTCVKFSIPSRGIKSLIFLLGLTMPSPVSTNFGSIEVR